MSITHSLQSLFAFYPNYRNSLEASRRRIPEAPQFKASRTRRIPLANDDGVERSKESINALVLSDSLCASRFCCCGRRRFIGASGAALLPILPSNASELERDTTAVLNKFHPPRPDWYEELYASIMDKSIAAYEEEVAGYKADLFKKLRGKNKKVMELGIGTGPNLKYYADEAGVSVVSVDPNKKMEKYAKEAAVAAGLPLSCFNFIQTVGEALPVSDASMDAVVGTLVLCSVKDVKLTLEERNLMQPRTQIKHTAAIYLK